MLLHKHFHLHRHCLLCSCHRGPQHRQIGRSPSRHSLGLQKWFRARAQKWLKDLRLYSYPIKQVRGIRLHPGDQKCAVLCWRPLGGGQHRQEALPGPPSGPPRWLQYSWHWIHWGPKGEDGQCHESQGQAIPVAWPTKMFAKEFLSAVGGLGISHQIVMVTLNAAGLLFGCRIAPGALHVLAFSA